MHVRPLRDCAALRLVLTTAVLALVFSSSAGAQTRTERDTASIQCRNASNELIGLTRSQLRARCGAWLSSRRVTDAVGDIETIVYGSKQRPLFTARLFDGVVTIVTDADGSDGARGGTATAAR